MHWLSDIEDKREKWRMTSRFQPEQLGIPEQGGGDRPGEMIITVYFKPRMV